MTSSKTGRRKATDRRSVDRRQGARPGADRRTGDRRSGADRRNEPRP